MIDIKTLLPEVAKLLPGVPQEELMAGIQEFIKAHPDFNNQQALQALTQYLQGQQQTPQAQSALPFKNLLSQIGAR